MATKVITVMNALLNQPQRKMRTVVRNKNKKEKTAKRVQVVEQTILQQEDDSDALNIMIGRVGDKTYPFVFDSGGSSTRESNA